MKIIKYFIFCLLIENLSAQEITPNSKNSKNLKQGRWTTYVTKDRTETSTIENSMLYEIGEMKNSKKQGLWTTYITKTKQKLTEINYVNGEKNGIYCEYNSDGKMVAKGTLINGKAQGLSAWYYPDGKKEAEVLYKNGKIEGEYREFDQKGEVIMVGNHKHGRRQGNWIIKLNKKGDEILWCDNNRHKDTIVFHTSGKMQNGSKKGLWTIYEAKTKAKVGEMSYVDGMLDGMFILYYDNGQILEKTSYTRGIKNGKHQEFNEKGVLIKEYTYKDGE